MTKKERPDRSVTTAFGKSAERSECRYIKGEFYKRDEECFNFDGRWYRINSGFLVQESGTDKWILKDSENVICGLIKTKDDVVKTGYFVKDVFKNIPVDTESIPSELKKGVYLLGKTTYAQSMAVVSKMKLSEDLPTGIYMSPTKASKKIAIHGTYNFPIDYSFETSGDAIKAAYKQYIKTASGKASKHNMLGNYSFGWEFETTDGYIHPRHLAKTSLIPLRDGSIAGFEYVTCPLQGQKGLDTTMEAAKVLGRYTTNNITCALHLHIGNVPVSEEFLANMFNTCHGLQNDLFAMFPLAMAHTSKYKDRDYCNKLPSLSTPNNQAHNIINWLAGRDGYYKSNFKGLGRENHPDDRSNNRKWAISQRYTFINFVPYVFSPRKTVEFRIHTPTSNPAKLINWLFICAGIITFADKYASTYTKEALKRLSIKKVMDIVYTDKDVAAYLNSYIDWRIKYMDRCAKSGDEVGSTEIMSDLDFEFPYKGQTTLVGNV